MLQLGTWLEQHEALRGIWPYDEVENLLTSVRADQRVTPEEHRTLLAFFADFAELPPGESVEGVANLTLKGICAVQPSIEFADRDFCLTGESSRATREELVAEVEQRHGRIRGSVSRETDYLVVGGAGSPCWAFACYGRKVEQAMNFRRQGHRVLIVHENDFWDAVA